MNRDREDYQRHLEAINRATDKEVDEAMADILRAQRARNYLRPAIRQGQAKEGESA
jgi:hypothetical protein